MSGVNRYISSGKYLPEEDFTVYKYFEDEVPENLFISLSDRERERNQFMLRKFLGISHQNKLRHDASYRHNYIKRKKRSIKKKNKKQRGVEKEGDVDNANQNSLFPGGFISIDEEELKYFTKEMKKEIFSKDSWANENDEYEDGDYVAVNRNSFMNSQLKGIE
jgi:hypothetical protein